jgi:hypothetical protein
LELELFTGLASRKYNEIVENNRRWYLFRDVAIEFLFADKRNFLCVFKNKKERQAVLQRIAGKNDPNAMKQSALGNFLLDTMQKAIDKAGTELDAVTRRWQTREISNVGCLLVELVRVAERPSHSSPTCKS